MIFSRISTTAIHFFLLALFIFSISVYPKDLFQQTRDDRCGLYALNYCFHLLSPGGSWAFVLDEEIEAGLGVSMWTMQQIAEKNGFIATGISLEVGELARSASVDRPHIFSSESLDHYYVCLGYKGDTVYVVDPIVAKTMEVDMEGLSDIYGGRALRIELAENTAPLDRSRSFSPLVVLAAIGSTIFIVGYMVLRAHRVRNTSHE